VIIKMCAIALFISLLDTEFAIIKIQKCMKMYILSKQWLFYDTLSRVK